jgi:hemoglobin
MTRLTGGVLAVALVAAAGCATLDDRIPIDKKSLYDRLGGKPAIAAVVDDFIGNVAADARINRRFEGADIPRLKGLLVEQICEATGGPCRYTGARWPRRTGG